MDGGIIFLILLLVGVAVYLGGGMLYNFFVMGLSGVQLIPHLSFWAGLPGNLKAWVVWCCGGCRRNRGYEEI